MFCLHVLSHLRLLACVVAHMSLVPVSFWGRERQIGMWAACAFGDSDLRGPWTVNCVCCYGIAGLLRCH